MKKLLIAALLLGPAAAQTFPSAEERAAIAAASGAERDRALKLLAISDMQPGATAYDIGKPGNANFDESKANPFPNLPDLLTFQNGTIVKTAAHWEKRKAEIKALFDENVYGKYPGAHPQGYLDVSPAQRRWPSPGVPAFVKHIVGHTDNSAESDYHASTSMLMW